MTSDFFNSLLENISSHVGAAGSVLIAVDRAAPVWVASPGVLPITERYFRDGWDLRNDRMSTLLRDNHIGFVRDIDIFEEEQIGELPIVRDFLRPAGYGWGGGLTTLVPSGEVLVLSVEQHFRDGPITDQAVAKLEALRPHIARASLLSAKLRFERAKAAVEAFGLAALPAALVRRDGRIVAANDLFAGIGGQLAVGARDRLHISFAGAGALLDSALRGGVKCRPVSVAIPAAAEAPPFVLHVLPAEGAARDIFGTATALLLVTRLDGRSAPGSGLLRALFDLTPMEANVAHAVVAGQESASIAARFHITSETFRTHVKAVLQKTGFRRRVDLVRFLSPIPSFDTP